MINRSRRAGVLLLLLWAVSCRGSGRSQREGHESTTASSAERTTSSGARPDAAAEVKATASIAIDAAQVKPNVYCMQDRDGVKVPPGRGKPALALLGQRFDIVPFQKRANGRYYYLIAEHDHAFQLLVEAPAHPGPTMSEAIVTCPDARKTINANVGIQHGDDAGIGIEVLTLGEPPGDVYQAIAQRLEDKTITFGFKFERASCSTTIDRGATCSAVVSRNPGLRGVNAIFWGAYVAKTHDLVTYTMFAPSTPSGGEAVITNGDLLAASFHVGS